MLMQARSVRLPASVMKKINGIRINERLFLRILGRKSTEEEIANKTNISLKNLQFHKKAAKDVTSLDKTLVSKAEKGPAAAGTAANGKTLESLIKDACRSAAGDDCGEGHVSDGCEEVDQDFVFQ